MIRTLFLDLISWLIAMQQAGGGCTQCMRTIHTATAPVVARCIHCAFFDMFDGVCMFGKAQPQGCDTLAAECEYYELENLTDCTCYELD